MSFILLHNTQKNEEKEKGNHVRKVKIFLEM